MTEANEYDEIFAALKHPVRRQILLFIERKGEASFTEIQQKAGIEDTGLMSYHLKELSPLMEQSKRGKYCLSEVGHAGVELFRKVEHERQRSSTVVHAEIEKYLAGAIKRSVFFLCIAWFTLAVPMIVDISLAVQGVLWNGYSAVGLVGMFLLTFLVMVAGAALFMVYDRHYYSKNAKTSIIHSTLYAIGVSILSSLGFYSIYTFNQQTLAAQLNATENLPLMFGVLRIAVFLAIAPTIAYAFNKVSSRRQDKTKQ